MTRYGPGKQGGSTRTVRKRAQRKRAKERQLTTREEPARPVKATGPPSIYDPETSLVKLKALSYEVQQVAAQLRKAGNSYGSGISGNDSIIQDTKRAYKILEGFLRENEQRSKHGH